MSKDELKNIVGGGINASMLNALSRGISCLYDLGRALGSTIRRIKNGSICPL